ncbi:hypothetical protein C4D60_Mb10t25020 [Musa balbisiana]|uniref:Uncharacterized protein n=1 Tax=Musa balbisiana TaxID=52838 RepID=A0A4S8IZP4_MUSBA|nr:hypothetical protein C4D60_Mb10t25020 [Musa balbisiana]
MKTFEDIYMRESSTIEGSLYAMSKRAAASSRSIGRAWWLGFEGFKRCRRDCCSEAGEISATCSDFCSDAGEICKVGDSCSNVVLEFGGRKSGGVFSGRLRLAREQQPTVETKAATVLPLGVLPTEEVSMQWAWRQRLLQWRHHCHLNLYYCDGCDLILAAASAAVGCSEWLRLRGGGIAARGMVERLQLQPKGRWWTPVGKLSRGYGG